MSIPYLPLAGVRIIDLTQLLPGPYCSLLLADLGADVIKVEDPQRPDRTRKSSPLVHDLGSLFHIVNRGKRSLTLNLKAEEGKEAFVRLVRTADVLFEGFRPGVMDRLCLGYEQLRSVNPRLVYCALTGFGQDGPYRLKPGHDINYIGYGGLLKLTGQASGPPVPSGLPVADLSGGTMAAFGVMVALFGRERTGRGQFVDVAMLDTIVSWLSLRAADLFGSGHSPERGKTQLTGAFPGYDVYETADGEYVAIGCLEEKFWRNLCEAIGLAEFVNDFPPTGDRKEQAREALRRTFLSRSRAEWVALLSNVETAFSPVNSVAETFADQQVKYRQMKEIADLGSGEQVHQLGFPVKLSEVSRTDQRLAPLLGQHSAEILVELGYSDSEIEELHRLRVI